MQPTGTEAVQEAAEKLGADAVQAGNAAMQRGRQLATQGRAFMVLREITFHGGWDAHKTNEVNIRRLLGSYQGVTVIREFRLVILRG